CRSPTTGGRTPRARRSTGATVSSRSGACSCSDSSADVGPPMPDQVNAGAAPGRDDELWRSLRWLGLIGAIAIRWAGISIEGPVLGTDQGYQIAGARSLLEGRGVTLQIVEASDLSSVSAVPLRWWPPLYSLIAAPLLAVLHDPALVLVTSTWAATVMLFGAWFAILELLGSLVDWRAKLLLWLFWMMVAPPITRDTTTGAPDHLALRLFSVGLG